MKKKPDSPSLDFGRRLYIDKNDNYVDAMSRTTNSEINWFLYLQKFSEFEKPYYNEDNYPAMQHFFPWAPWFDFDFIIDAPPDFNVTESTKYPTDYYLVPGCIISCWPPFADDCEDTIDCYTLVMDVGIGEWSIVETDGPLGKTKTDFTQFGEPKFIIYPPEGGWTEEGTRVKVGFVDSRGAYCETEVYAYCWEEEEEEECPLPFSYDEDNPDTIDTSDSTYITVIEGLAPFSWSVGGNGFSFDRNITGGRSNILYTSETACGAGTITVTDSCGTIVTGYIRCTAGGWTGCGSFAQGGCCNAGCQEAEVYPDGMHIAIINCGTRSGYGTTEYCGAGECAAVCVTAGDCPQANGKICSANLYYWSC